MPETCKIGIAIVMSNAVSAIARDISRRHRILIEAFAPVRPDLRSVAWLVKNDVPFDVAVLLAEAAGAAN